MVITEGRFWSGLVSEGKERLFARVWMQAALRHSRGATLFGVAVTLGAAGLVGAVSDLHL
jgi:hypothetical protein